MLGNREELAHLQSDFYRDKYRKTLRWLLFSVVLIYVLIGLIIFFILFQPAQSYYANTTEGQILVMPRIVALS